MADFTKENSYHNEVSFGYYSTSNQDSRVTIKSVDLSFGADRQWGGVVSESALYPTRGSATVDFTFNNNVNAMTIITFTMSYYSQNSNGKTVRKQFTAQPNQVANWSISCDIEDDQLLRAFYYGSTKDILHRILLRSGTYSGKQVILTVDPSECVFDKPVINKNHWKLQPCTVWKEDGNNSPTKSPIIPLTPTSDLTSYYFRPEYTSFVSGAGNVLEFYFDDEESSTLKGDSSPNKGDKCATYNIINANDRYYFDSSVTAKICQKIMKQDEVKKQYTLHISQWQRITIKHGTYAEGTYVLLPDGEVEQQGKSTTGNLVNKLYFVSRGLDLVVQPTRGTNSLVIQSASIIDPHNVGVLHTGGSKIALKMQVNLSWDIKEADLKIPTNCGLYRVKDIKIKKTEATNYSEVFDLSMPQNYPDGYVKQNQTAEPITGIVTLTTDKDDEINKNFSTSADGLKLGLLDNKVYRYIPLDFKEFTAFRCNEDGTANSEGNFISVLPVFTYSSFNSKNKLTAHLSIVKLRDKTKLFEGDIAVTSGQPYLVSSPAADRETSYHCTLTISDKFTSATKAYNVGTIETYFEVGPGESQVSVGKYCEVEKGFEVQFPSYFYRQVAFLNNAKNMSDAARVIDYTDNEKIGATNIQGALDWILARLG